MNKPTTLNTSNRATEFLIFVSQSGAERIEVKYEDNTVWLTQRLMSELFGTAVSTINEHLKNIYEEGELDKESTIRNFRIVRNEGERDVERKLTYYNLDAIISIGYRVNSTKATQFRQWATAILGEFAIKGYVLDKKRMENGTFLGEDYFERLLSEIREIRLSERRFYQKITDIYATSIDYNKNALTTRNFFAKVQNKLHYAIHRHTAAELIAQRADSNKDHMGLQTWDAAPDGKIVKSDVIIAKNYLTTEELSALGRIVGAYLDLAEDRAKRKIAMTMQDWDKNLDKFLEFNENDLLEDSGKISGEIAKIHAEKEFEKYRIVQDRIFVSDFDKEVKKLSNIDKETLADDTKRKKKKLL